MILLYHHIAPPEMVPHEWEPNEGWHLTHTPAGFDRHLLVLRARGYRFVSLAELVDNIRQKGNEGASTVALTFDDGWADNFTYALPILRRHSALATFFVTSAHLRNGSDDARKMNLPQLKELLQAGMIIGGHTRSHQDLTKLSLQDADRCVKWCKEDLEQALGVKTRFFSYPGGTFNRGVAQLVRDAGYDAACSILGPARNDASSLFWLYRDVLTESMDSMHDRYRLSPVARRLFSFRVHRRLHQQLGKQ